MRCSGEISGSPGDTSLTATVAGDQGEQHPARGPVKSTVGGQDAGIGSVVSYCRVPKTPSGTQARTVWILPTSHPVGKTDRDAGDNDPCCNDGEAGCRGAWE